MSKLLLSLDLSTTSTGWSIFNMETGKLLEYDNLKPNMKGGVAKLVYPRQQLTKMVDLAIQIKSIVDNYKPTTIVIEEIAGSRQRLGQKVLDGLHWVVLMYLQDVLDVVVYYDVTGPNGWRHHLGLRLTEIDKLRNKEAKKLNPKLDSKSRLPIVDAKDLAARYVNEVYGLELDPQTKKTDSDIGDSIAMGSAYLKIRCPNSKNHGKV